MQEWWSVCWYLIFFSILLCFLQITSVWLPFIRKQVGEDIKTPVILVGNKQDLIDFSSMEVCIYLFCYSHILSDIFLSSLFSFFLLHVAIKGLLSCNQIIIPLETNLWVVFRNLPVHLFVQISYKVTPPKWMNWYRLNFIVSFCDLTHCFYSFWNQFFVSWTTNIIWKNILK